MKLLFILMLLCLATNAFSQNGPSKNTRPATLAGSSSQQSKYTSAEIKRLADLGRIWGMVNYFHPAMGGGNISTADLIVPNAAALANDPSATSFKTIVKNMLAQLKDASTTLTSGSSSDTAILFTSGNIAAVHRLLSGYWYIALPTAAVSAGDISSIPGIMPNEWDSAKGILLDLRNKTNEPYIDYDFIEGGLPLIEKKLAGNIPLPEQFERIVYHNGMVPQENGQNNIYYSGWKTVSKVTKVKNAVQDTTGSSSWNKPFAVIINSNTSFDLVKRLQSLRVAGKCLVIYEGDAAAYPTGNIIKVPVADGQTLDLRTSDMVFGSNAAAPLPDLVVPVITSIGEQGTFMQQCIRLLNEGAPQSKTGTQNLSLQYIIPAFADTKTGFYPGTGERLLALYNFWNAIRYFNPYQKLLPKEWDTVLEEHLPDFVQAKDSVEYNFALRRLISEIHDCHGFFYSPKGTTPVRYEFGSWPAIDVKFIGEKLYMVSIGKDSLPGKNIQIWDEITAIDGDGIAKCLEKWRWYTATSNEATYKRDIAGVLLGGKLNSPVTVTINRGGRVLKETLLRSGRYSPKDSTTDFNYKYPVMKLMDNNTGYVNMGALKSAEVDSMFILFKNTKAIIMDIRNYPQGTAWTIAPRLTAVKNAAVKFHYPLITADNVNGGEDDMMGESFFYVNPDTSKPVYKGKIIMLCNAKTQSQAEYTIMMLQGATDVTVIGSQTAGADGNVTTVVLPGNYRASFSGLEILYPDGSQTQRSGIKVDIQCSPTIKGLKEGRDELMERALQYVKVGK